jgi:DNA-binding ferritin-like protein
MTDKLATITEQAKQIGHHPHRTAQGIKADQQLANAAESIAIQMSLINQKLDLLIEVIEKVAQRP